MRAVTAMAILLLGVAAPGGAQQPQEVRVGRETRAAVLDTVARALRAVYVLPEAGERMADALTRARGAGLFDTLSNPHAFASRITRELRRAHRDVHLRIVYDPAEEARMRDTTRREVRDTRERDRRENFHFQQARILPGNIGYLEFTQFADTSAEARRTVQAAMRFVANTDALVIDLRDNRGGSAAMTREIQGYFVKDSARWSRSYNRVLDRWSDEVITNDSAVTGGTYLAMPITLLISQWTFSAAEGLTYNLKHGRNARVVGQASAGGAHVLRRVGLGHGFVAFIPYVRPVNVFTNSNWEGTGVIPDTVAEAPRALLTALELILHERAATAPDSAAQRAARFALNAARAAEQMVDVPVATLQDYTGVFEEYSFMLVGGRLHSANESRNGRTDRLIPITASLFQVDRLSQVEFLRDDTGAVNRLRLFWNDGWVDLIDRSRPK